MVIFRKSGGFLICFVVAVLLLVATLCSCNKSKMFLSIREPNEPNNCSLTVLELSGKPAEVLVDKVSNELAANIRSAAGRENALFDQLKKFAAPLLLLFVGGLIFWGFTRSKWGWVIPAAAVGGLGLIMVFVQLAKYIVWGLAGVAFLVVIWKAYEYQKERNISLDKIKELVK